VHLAHIAARPGTQRLPLQTGKAQFVERQIGCPLASELRTQPRQWFAVAPFGDPRRTHRRQALTNVDLCQWIGVRPGTVVDVDRRVLLATESRIGIRLRDLAHRHPDIRSTADDENLARVGQRPDGRLIHMRVSGHELFVSIHRSSLQGRMAEPELQLLDARA
jgi:hypothetical protein